MKFKLLPKVLVALFVANLISYILISCKDVESIPSQEQQQSKLSENIKFLEFKDGKEFIEKLNLVSKMEKEEFNQWEKLNGFVSMRSVYVNILEAEQKNIDNEEIKIKNQPALKATLKHKFSDIFEANKDIIKFNEFGFELNIHDINFANIINRNGIVKIGNVIHQFSKEKAKFVKSGEENKINQLNMFKNDGIYMVYMMILK
jgi:hypothetical protein